MRDKASFLTTFKKRSEQAYTFALDAIHKTKRTISEHNFSKFRHFFVIAEFLLICTKQGQNNKNDSPMHSLPTICR
jgi:hypothetical protein